MRAYHVTGPGALELREVARPRPRDGEVLLEIRAALTCGTDLKLFRRGHPKMPFPTPIGHEFAGVVVEAGPGARFPVGTQLMSVHTAPCGTCPPCLRRQENLCDEAMRSMTLGGFAESLLLPRRVVEINAFEKPPELPWAHAALLEPLSCVVHGLDVIGVREGDTVAVVGAGPIGLLQLQVARARGAERVVVVGRRPARLEAARRLGADAVIDELSGSDEDTRRAVVEATGGGADVVVECVARPEAWQQAVDFARRGGRVLWFGGCKPGTEVRLDTYRLHYDEITACGAFHFTPRAVAEARRLLVEKALDVDPLISGTLPLDDLAEALSRIGRGEGIKYALVP